MNGHQMRFNTERSLIKIKRILEILDKAPLSSAQLSAVVHMNQIALMRYIQHLMTCKPRQVFVLRYDTIDQQSVPIYAKGDKPNARRTTKSGAQKWAEIKADPVRLARVRERSRNNRAAKREQTGEPKSRRIYNPPLQEQITSLLEEVPGHSASSISIKLDAPVTTVLKVVNKLRKKGIIQRAMNGTLKEYQWELPHKPLPASLSKTLKLKPQSWAAALGV